MKKIILILAAILTMNVVFAQTYKARNGSLYFNPNKDQNHKDYAAESKEATAVFNTDASTVALLVPIKSFKFKKALMEEHFNENYLESNLFPKAVFKGAVSDISKVKFTTDGIYNVMVSGDLTMHGVTNKVSTAGTLTIKNGVALGSSKFIVKLADYNIAIPKLVKDNISETIEITVNCEYNQKL